MSLVKSFSVSGSNFSIFQRNFSLVLFLILDSIILISITIKKNVRALWTWKEDNFTMIYENYDGEDRIYTSSQLLKLLSK